MADDEARTELTAFLKSRRKRLSPADFGLPRNDGRRAPGLRREEVAALSGIGLTWYTRLEQGKEIQVSTAFLDNLARGLRFSSAERAHLFALAQHRLPPSLPPTLSRTQPDEGLQAILDSIGSPAYARTGRFDVVAWNAANTAMFGNFAIIPAADRNVIRLTFLRGYHRRSMPDWEADARALLAKFRINLGLAVDKTPFLSLVEDLAGSSAEFRRLWAEHEVSDPGEGVTYFHSPRQGDRHFRHHLLMPEAWPDLRIVLFIPN
ncbi:helix-turn-helix domain-containing protein [Labrys sp. LIt4]|uniref:helix-turn-helix transcriptional regulator n=1 Tax=Labrys sp. LIt4 TaxID=2821355 RepID=UPI001AE078CA|nr:helix-turn-helix transcriptional regulator [Labrys sp. LIt4]MBP0579760.1 helix-turn-helix domain-containing protein [Labrys sp. LIt4]